MSRLEQDVSKELQNNKGGYESNVQSLPSVMSNNVENTNTNDSNTTPTLNELFLGSNRTRLEADVRSLMSNDDPTPSEIDDNDDIASVVSIEYKRAQEFRQQRELEIDDTVETTPVQSPLESPSHHPETQNDLAARLSALLLELETERNLRRKAETEVKRGSEEIKLMCENFERIKNDLLNRMNDMSKAISTTTATAQKAQATAEKAQATVTALNTKLDRAHIDERIKHFARMHQ